MIEPIMSTLENAACGIAPTIISSVTGGVIGGVMGCVSSPFVASVSVVTGISSNILRNKNEQICPPIRIAREWVCFTTMVGASSGAVIGVAYQISSYSLGFLASYFNS